MRRLLMLFIGWLPAALCAQTAALRKAAVERSLMPFVPVTGYPGWKLEDRMKAYGIPGVSIAVIRDGVIDWAEGYGWADTTRKIPVTTHTLFSAGSISKLVLAAAAFRLVQDRHIDLDAPVNRYLRSWAMAENEWTKARPVTLRMLLSHTAGTTQSSYFGFTPDKNPLPTVVEILSGAPVAESRPVVVNSEPGKEFRYSGGGSMIAQLALMDVTGQSFLQLTDSLLFRPLGMRRTTFSQPLPPHLAKEAAWAYSAAPWFKGMPYVYPQQAAAGLYTTPSDLALLLIDLQKSFTGKGGLLQPSAVQTMMQPQAEVSLGFYQERIGVGPFLIEQTGSPAGLQGRYFEFTGVNAGFLAYCMADLGGRNGCVIMLNGDHDVNGLGKEIRRAIAQVYGWTAFLPPPLKPLSPAPPTLHAYTGRYRRGPDEVVYISAEGNHLMERINSGMPIPTFFTGKDTVRFTDFNVSGYFSRAPDGRVTGLRTEYQKEPMPRMSDEEYTPGEHLLAGRWEEAKAGYRSMNLNEYAITYMVYELLHIRPARLPAARALLQLAEEQHPRSAIVHARWGDYHLKTGNPAAARAAYTAALKLDPKDKETVEKLARLQ